MLVCVVYNNKHCVKVQETMQHSWFSPPLINNAQKQHSKQTRNKNIKRQEQEIDSKKSERKQNFVGHN